MVVQAYNKYCDMVEEYYSSYNRTEEIHIDVIILIYKKIGSRKAFNLLFKLHKPLLLKITRNIFNKYKKYLMEEDLYELQSMVFCEFYRRVLYYTIPPRAPFSKYIKLYLRQWANAYIKPMVRYQNRNKFKGIING